MLRLIRRDVACGMLRLIRRDVACGMLRLIRRDETKRTDHKCQRGARRIGQKRPSLQTHALKDVAFDPTKR
jgi:hypothetical protein